jgi:hypothetical protein
MCHVYFLSRSEEKKLTGKTIEPSEYIYINKNDEKLLPNTLIG